MSTPNPVAAETTPRNRPRDRDVSIDLLRAIAILEVMFAHSGVSGWLFQVRNFGVPLLVLLSGWSIGISLQRRPISFFAYIVHRTRRLVLPTWGFLACYFLLFLLLDATGLTARHYPWSTVFDSFVLDEGIGYIWVIRVNLLVSLVTLPLLALNRRTESHALYIGLCAATVLASELTWMAFSAAGLSQSTALLPQIVTASVFYLTGYGALFAFGLRLPQLSSQVLLTLSLLCGALFVFLAIRFWQATGAFVPTQGFKYPPQIYYIAYALFISLALVAGRAWLLRAIPEGRARHAAVFIGSNTLSIYLWHIPAVEILKDLTAAGFIPNSPLVSFIITALFAIIATLLQHRVVGALELHRSRRRLPLSQG